MPIHNEITTEMIEAELKRIGALKAKVYAAVVHAHNKGSGDAGTRALNDRKLAYLNSEVRALEVYIACRKACDEAGV